MPTFREHCSSLHQDEKQPDTVQYRPDEVNCNVHETLALNNGSRQSENLSALFKDKKN